jgi:GNAT superfamily N-acetyltransferase
MALVFRSALATDGAQIVALVESAYRGEVSQQGWTTEADLLDGQRTDLNDVLRLISATKSEIVLAFDGDALVGSAHIQLHVDGCHFGMFAVKPNLQGGGVGKALLAEGERRARLNFNATEMRMWVIWLRDRLIAFYLRRGYQLTAEREAFPYGDAQFGLPKRDDLYFIVLSKKLSG